MRVRVDMQPTERLDVDAWWATGPLYVVDALAKQLQAATAIWPDLMRVHLSIPHNLTATPSSEKTEE